MHVLHAFKMKYVSFAAAMMTIGRMRSNQAANERNYSRRYTTDLTTHGNQMTIMSSPTFPLLTLGFRFQTTMIATLETYIADEGLHGFMAPLAKTINLGNIVYNASCRSHFKP